jgi:hypothetical protein
MLIRKRLQSIFGRSNARKRAKIDGSIIEFQQGKSRDAAVHYREKGSCLSLYAEWEANKDNIAYLSVTLPETVSLVGVTLDDDATMLLAQRISRGLQEIGIKYSQIVQSLPPIPIAAEECEAGPAEVRERMATQGWNVTYDKPAGTMKWERVPGVEGKIPAMDARELAELTLSAAQSIRGSVSRHRTLIETPGIRRGII